MTAFMGRRSAIFVFAFMAASLTALMVGCSAPQLSTPPSPEALRERPPGLQAWNPAVVADPGGRVYMTFYGKRPGETYGLYFTRSFDGGRTWLPDPIHLDTPNEEQRRIGFHRLDSNGTGAVTVTWSIERLDASYWHVKEVRHLRSSDSGASWPKEVVRWRFDEGGSNFATPLTATDGSLLLFWTQKSQGQVELRFVRTRGESGAWLGAPIKVPGPKTALASSDKRTKPPSSEQQEAAWPSVASDGHERLFTVWQATTTSGTHVYFNRSLDGGATWLGAARRLNSPPSFWNTSRLPVIAYDRNDGVYAFWEDLRHDKSDLYFNRSLDGGTTWLDEDIRITPTRPPQEASTSPAVRVDRSGHLYTAWLQYEGNSFVANFNRSLDRGKTWFPRAIRLDHHEKDMFSYALKLRSDDEGHVYAVWWERGQKGVKDSIHFNRSVDYGATWLEKDLRLDSEGPGKGTDGSRFPWIDSDGKGTVYVVWSSDQNGTLDIFLNRSTDHGQTWLPREIQITR
jgi:hypothetical protein